MEDHDRAGFRSLAEGTSQDWAIIARAETRYRRDHQPSDRLLALLASLEHADPVGYPVNLYTHCVQTATRVLDAGHDDELVVAALFHDLPEAVSDNHHGLLAAQLLAPWISDRRTWLLVHHVEFQDAYFATHPTRDPKSRNKYVGHPYFDETAHFCECYDQNSFDPDFVSLPLKEFAPIVRRFFAGAIPALAPLPA